MAKSAEDLGGCGCGILGIAFLFWLAWPAGDQVCRDHKTPIWDSITGADKRPTCQEMIDDLDSRITTLEAKINHDE